MDVYEEPYDGQKFGSFADDINRGDGFMPVVALKRKADGVRKNIHGEGKDGEDDRAGPERWRRAPYENDCERSLAGGYDEETEAKQWSFPQVFREQGEVDQAAQKQRDNDDRPHTENRWRSCLITHILSLVRYRSRGIGRW